MSMSAGYSLCSLCLYFAILIIGTADVDRKWKNLGVHNQNDAIDWDPDQPDEYRILKNSIGVFKEGPENYLLTFAEVRPNRPRMVIGEDAFNDNLFPPIWHNKSNIRKRREEDVTVSLENTATPASDHHSDVIITSGEAEEVVSAVLKSTEGVRKALGVCRKHVPRHFVNPPLDNATDVVIKNIVGCIQEKLQDDLSCKDCITLHTDMQLFINWLIHGNTGLPCCPSIARKMYSPEVKKHMFLFNQESFGGSKCAATVEPHGIPTICEVVGGTEPKAEETHPKKKVESLVKGSVIVAK